MTPKRSHEPVLRMACDRAIARQGRKDPLKSRTKKRHRAAANDHEREPKPSNPRRRRLGRGIPRRGHKKGRGCLPLAGKNFQRVTVRLQFQHRREKQFDTTHPVATKVISHRKRAKRQRVVGFFGSVNMPAPTRTATTILSPLPRGDRVRGFCHGTVRNRTNRTTRFQPHQYRQAFSAELRRSLLRLRPLRQKIIGRRHPLLFGPGQLLGPGLAAAVVPAAPRVAARAAVILAGERNRSVLEIRHRNGNAGPPREHSSHQEKRQQTFSKA